MVNDKLGIMNGRRLYGFTLVEMLVSMALVGSVLILGMFLYSTFVKFHRQYEQKLSSAEEIALVQYQLRKDVRMAASITLSSPDILALEDWTGQAYVSYSCLPLFMIRHTSERRDTFEVAAAWHLDAFGSISLTDTARLWQIPLAKWARSSVQHSSFFPN